MISTRDVAKAVGVTAPAIYQMLEKHGHFYGVTPERTHLAGVHNTPWLWPDDAPQRIRAARRAAGREVYRGE